MEAGPGLGLTAQRLRLLLSAQCVTEQQVIGEAVELDQRSRRVTARSGCSSVVDRPAQGAAAAGAGAVEGPPAALSAGQPRLFVSPCRCAAQTQVCVCSKV